MDGLTLIVFGCVAGVALIRGLAPMVGSGMRAHVAALGQLFGGWRPLPWPRGVQEDDPEAAWAKHGERTNPSPARPSTGSSPPTASIEYLD
jgi:hypothetical protein